MLWLSSCPPLKTDTRIQAGIEEGASPCATPDIPARQPRHISRPRRVRLLRSRVSGAQGTPAGFEPGAVFFPGAPSSIGGQLSRVSSHRLRARRGPLMRARY